MVFLFGKLAAAAAATLMIPAVLSKPVTPASVPLHPKLLNPSVDHEVPNSFIVGYHSNVSVATMQSHMASITTQLFKRSSDVIGAGIGSVYHIGSMKAFQVTADMGTINAIADAPEVAYVEKDFMTALASPIHVQEHAPWGLTRISHKVYHHDAPTVDDQRYIYDDSAGRSVNVYVIDSGIRIDHVDFEGRASWGANFANDVDTDELGHGTHCAGIIAGRTFGVAKKANVIAVKVFGKEGYGKNSVILKGVHWVVANAPLGSIINASWRTFTESNAVNDAIQAVVDTGLTFVMAAGNNGMTLRQAWPHSKVHAITVGAIDDNNERASFSNYGGGVDVYAPGVNIISAFNTDPRSYAFKKGTSMAAPHVAGLAAYIIALEGIWTPEDVANRIRYQAIQGVVTFGQVSSNLIAYNDAS